MTVVEIVAQAICNWHGCPPEEFARMVPTERGLALSRGQAALTALAEAGYVVVPREPTEEMVKAGALFDRENRTLADYNRARDQMKVSYRAALAAAGEG